ncbi:MAG: acylphosphatase [Methanothrix sp.]|nr:acylphosphatase [Methanothrix sp.]
MKLKIKIIGPKVHDVGYRVFLLKHAMNMALPGLSTYNWDEEDHQEVIALVKGDESRIKAFLKTVEKDKPELAEVTKVTSEPYDGYVGRTSEVAMLCSFVQLDKAIPLLLDMRDDLKEMKVDIKEMKGDIKEMKGDIKEMKGDIKEMKVDIKAVRQNTDMIPQMKANTDVIPQVLEEVKGLREDIQPGHGMSMRQVQADIKAIKEQIGMT